MYAAIHQIAVETADGLIWGYNLNYEETLVIAYRIDDIEADLANQGEEDE